MSSESIKLGILLCGHIPEELTRHHSAYDGMFRQLLGEDTFTYTTYDVTQGNVPINGNDEDAWLITGSRHGVYEDHAWIAPLENLIRDAYAKAVPIVGVCFGHQILAQALGGRVEKFSGGWSVGRVTYNMTETFGNGPTDILAFHQDQVVELPNDAKVIGSTDFCQYAALRYGNKALSLQPHPEFYDSYMADLIETRGKIMSKETREQARTSLGKKLATESVAKTMVSFLQQKPV